MRGTLKWTMASPIFYLKKSVIDLISPKNRVRIAGVAAIAFLLFSFQGVFTARSAQVSSRSDTLNNANISSTSNHTVVFTVQDDIAAGETLTIDFPDFSTVGDIDCGDVDAATSVEFSFNSAGHLASCAPTATAWGFGVAGTVLTFTAPTAPGVYVATNTVLTVRIGSNATFQEQGASWITNSGAGTKFVNISGTFQQNAVVSGITVVILEGTTVSATVAGPAPTPTPAPSPTPTPAPGGGGGGGTILPPAGETAVTLAGKAYPRAFVTGLKNGQVVATVNAGDNGVFEIKLKGIQPGIYTFGVFAEDAKARKSLTLSFTINVIKDLTNMISGIFIPPTITTNRDIFYPDETLEVDGYAFPKSNVNVVLNSSHEVLERVSSDADGLWLLAYPLQNLGLGDHSTRAKTQAPDGDQSTFSETRLFRIFPKGVPLPTPTGPVCHGADLNNDGKVNLVDFSILLFWWQSRNPLNPCADINKDGIVNLVDFSIMMFQWTK